MSKLKTYTVRIRSELIETVQLKAKSQKAAEELVMEGEYTDKDVVDKDYDHCEVIPADHGV